MRVSGAVFKVSDFEGVFKVSDFAPSKMRSVRFRVVCKVSGCEMSSFRNFEPSKNFEPSVRIFEPSENFETSARKCRDDVSAAIRFREFASNMLQTDPKSVNSIVLDLYAELTQSLRDQLQRREQHGDGGSDAKSTVEVSVRLATWALPVAAQ